MSDIESPLWTELAASNINPAPDGWPPNSSPNIDYSNGRELMAAIKRAWNRAGPTVTSGGSANTQTLTYGVTPTEGYKQGQHFGFIVGFNNSGATTLNVNGLGAKNIFLGGVALTGGELIVGSVAVVAYDGTQFHIVAASAGRASPIGYLPLTGGTLTGALNISGASGVSRYVAGQTTGVNRWALVLGNTTAESGSNTGSDFNLFRYSDAGTVIDAPLTINRANGVTAFAGTLTVGANVTITAGGAITCAAVTINGAAASNRQLLGQTATSPRWTTILGDNTAESGSNNGSDWTIQAFSDAGGFLFNPIKIKRSTGVVTFSAAIVNGPSDRSLKENIQPLDGALDKVQQLQGVSFDFIKDPTKRRQIGLIAQDVAPIVPEVMQDFIQPDEEPKLAIDYTRLVPLLVEAIKELTAKVARLEAGLAAASQA